MKTDNEESVYNDDLTMEVNNENVYSIKSYNNLTFQTLNPQGLYNSVGLLSVTINRTRRAVRYVSILLLGRTSVQFCQLQCGL